MGHLNSSGNQSSNTTLLVYLENNVLCRLFSTKLPSKRWKKMKKDCCILNIVSGIQRILSFMPILRWPPDPVTKHAECIIRIKIHKADSWAGLWKKTSQYKAAKGILVKNNNHTGKCKRTGGCYNELVVAFYSTGGGVKGEKIYTCWLYYLFINLHLFYLWWHLVHRPPVTLQFMALSSNWWFNSWFGLQIQQNSEVLSWQVFFSSVTA